MSTLIKHVTLSLLSTAMGIAILVAPLTSTVYAAENPSATINSYDGDQQRTTDQHHDKDDRDHRDHRDHQAHRFHMMSNFAQHHMEMYQNWQNSNQIDGSIENPVDVVMSVADVLGFDVNTDTFNLISQDSVQAVVQVIHNGNIYNIIVNHPSAAYWTVSAMTPVQ